jgi:aminoglycoside phosphotransferase (APT) family kinase protein
MLAQRTAATHLAVVHGDVSPKNILLGPHGPVLLDAECAWFGDPAFDVAFCLNHLLIKSVKLPHRAGSFRDAARALADAHAARVDWEPSSALTARVVSLLPAMTLARVDGSSPVEYLNDDERGIVRTIGRALLRAPSTDLDQLLDRWATLADQASVGAS